ncbi:unnamed protein product [Phaeothamnion confervicola]
MLVLSSTACSSPFNNVVPPALIRTVEYDDCHLAPLEYGTRCLWIDLTPEAIETIHRRGLDLDAGVHAAAHALLGVTPLFLMCDAGDLGAVHVREHRRHPTPKKVVLFDRKPGGIGMAEALFRRRREVLLRAVQMVDTCGCAGGCIGCIFTHSCAGYNSQLDKAAGALLLRGALRTMAEALSPVLLMTAAMVAAPVAAGLAAGMAANGGGSTSSGDDGGRGCGTAGAGGSPGVSAWPPDQTNSDDEGSAAATGAGDGAAADGVRADFAVSPRKKRRLLNMVVARGMQGARERDWQVRRPWLPSTSRS